jgi:hypothetical protein
MRKRGVKSPDRAEAVMLAFADRTPAIIRHYENLYKQPCVGVPNKAQPRPPREEMGLEGGDDDEGNLMTIYLRERERLEGEARKR